MSENTIYVRNARPNTVVIRYGDLRISLAHRGGLGRDLPRSPGDACALPADALNDPTIAKWLRNGTLEEISKDAFMKLSRRTIEVAPGQFLARPVRGTKGVPVGMQPAEADAGKTKTQVSDQDVGKAIDKLLTPEWAGELMTTEEELEEMDLDNKAANYPSKHRDEDEASRRQMGY